MVIQEDAILHAEDVSVQQMCVRGSLQGQLMSVCPSESEEDVHHHHTPAVPVSMGEGGASEQPHSSSASSLFLLQAGGHPEEVS